MENKPLPQRLREAYIPLPHNSLSELLEESAVEIERLQKILSGIESVFESYPKKQVEARPYRIESNKKTVEHEKPNRLVSDEKFVEHLEHASKVVRTWPKWKQDLLTGIGK